MKQSSTPLLKSALRAIHASTLLLVGLLCIVGHAHANTDISADKFLEIPAKERVLLDVRTPEEYADGHIPSAINMPVGELPDLFSKLDKNQQIVVYCRSGYRAGKAISFLEKQGFTDLLHLDGDYSAWAEEKREIVKPTTVAK